MVTEVTESLLLCRSLSLRLTWKVSNRENNKWVFDPFPYCRSLTLRQKREDGFDDAKPSTSNMK